ncbi:MAG: hypothetical protein AB2556_18545, partial [Candidatus Thiodiazotropha sp.]
MRPRTSRADGNARQSATRITDDSLAWLFEGTGIRYYKTPDELVERLVLCCGSLEAGNTSKELKNE